MLIKGDPECKNLRKRKRLLIVIRKVTIEGLQHNSYDCYPSIKTVVIQQAVQSHIYKGPGLLLKTSDIDLNTNSCSGYIKTISSEGKLNIDRSNIAELFNKFYLDVGSSSLNKTVQPPNTSFQNMMTSSNGKIFRVTGPLCGEFTGPRWIPRTKASDAELWCFLWSAPE